MSYKVRKFFAVIFVSVMIIMSSMLSNVFLVNAAPKAEVASTNLWGSGGQIILDLSDCSSCDNLTVIVEFDGTVKSASGWGFDTYKVAGNKVIATVNKNGSNAWAFDSSVGIQVEGSDVKHASFVSINDSSSEVATKEKVNSDSKDNADTATETETKSGNSSDSSPQPEVDNKERSPIAGDDWLTTDGRKIVDKSGNEVWLTGLSWFGYNTGTNIFDGCWACSLSKTIKSIADHGFNLIRVPMSAEILLDWKNENYPKANYNTASNSDLEGKNSLEIFDYVLDLCAENGIKIMPDIHSCESDAMGHMKPLWYTDKMSADKYFEALEWISNRYKDNDTIIAYDIKNEPHGAANEPDKAIWNDSDDENNFRAAAIKAGNIILDANPNLLIMIEGIQIYPKDMESNNFTSSNDADYHNSWWGGNLRAVSDYPIDFGDNERNRQIVYSPHDYGPSVYNQPWFDGGFSYESLIEDYWHDSWLYIAEDNIAPLLIGEWGGFMSGDNLTWMTYMRQLISEKHLHHTFWCFNANSGDTGGLVLDDFNTWDEEKYNFVKQVLWQNEQGKFIGLDHAVPLGVNGISLAEFTGEANNLIEEITPDATDSAEKTDALKGNSENDEDQRIYSGMASIFKIAMIVLAIILIIIMAIMIFYQRKNKKSRKN